MSPSLKFLSSIFIESQKHGDSFLVYYVILKYINFHSTYYLCLSWLILRSVHVMQKFLNTFMYSKPAKMPFLSIFRKFVRNALSLKENWSICLMKKRKTSFEKSCLYLYFIYILVHLEFHDFFLCKKSEKIVAVFTAVNRSYTRGKKDIPPYNISPM